MRTDPLALQPGISVAKVALEYGINANLLRKWMGQYRETGHSNPNSPLALPAFVSVQPLSVGKPTELAISAELTNGVKLALPSVALSELPLLLKALAELPFPADGGLCCHVPARPECTTPQIRFLYVAPRL